MNATDARESDWAWRLCWIPRYYAFLRASRLNRPVIALLTAVSIWIGGLVIAFLFGVHVAYISAYIFYLVHAVAGGLRDGWTGDGKAAKCPVIYISMF